MDIRGISGEVGAGRLTAAVLGCGDSLTMGATLPGDVGAAAAAGVRTVGKAAGADGCIIGTLATAGKSTAGTFLFAKNGAIAITISTTATPANNLKDNA